MYFINFFQFFFYSSKKANFLKKLWIFSCRTSRSLAQNRVGIFGALKCRNFWSLCVGQIGAPPWHYQKVIQWWTSMQFNQRKRIIMNDNNEWFFSLISRFQHQCWEIRTKLSTTWRLGRAPWRDWIFRRNSSSTQSSSQSN